LCGLPLLAATLCVLNIGFGERQGCLVVFGKTFITAGLGCRFMLKKFRSGAIVYNIVRLE
jgi:hypothetical protein